MTPATTPRATSAAAMAIQPAAESPPGRGGAADAWWGTRVVLVPSASVVVVVAGVAERRGRGKGHDMVGRRHEEQSRAHRWRGEVVGLPSDRLLGLDRPRGRIQAVHHAVLPDRPHQAGGEEGRAAPDRRLPLQMESGRRGGRGHRNGAADAWEECCRPADGHPAVDVAAARLSEAGLLTADPAQVRARRASTRCATSRPR